LALAEFTVNNKAYLATKFIANYSRELRMEVNIRRKRIEKALKFVERMKKVQKEVRVALKRA